MSIQENERTFCNNIKALRKKRNLSLEDLSRRSGAPLAMLEVLERGMIPAEMMVDDAFELAKAFGCEINELFES